MSLGVAIVGMLFKFFHLPGANILLIAGLGTFSLVGLAKAATEPDLADKIVGLCMAILAVGFLYKMMHYRGASIMFGLALGAGAVAALMVYRQAKK